MLTLSSQCLTCPIGHFCGPASIQPTPCPPGTWSNQLGVGSIDNCYPCYPGHSCPFLGAISVTEPCAPGHYCPSGTKFMTQYECPPGTFTDSINLTKISECSPCFERYSCDSGSTPADMVLCPKGYYCPLSTSTGEEIPCPPGTYSSYTGIFASSQCQTCPGGSFCHGGGANISGVCSPGYYCPPGTAYTEDYPCPSGTFSSALGLFDISQCQDCPIGQYCLEASTQPIPCPAGTYSSSIKTTNSGPGIFPSCQLCDAGYYCDVGSIHQQACGVGKYSDTGASGCSTCLQGYYCASNTTTHFAMMNGGGSWSRSADLAGACFNGTVCLSGMKTIPQLTSNACPAGFYCPVSTWNPIPCPAGKYSSSPGIGSVQGCLVTPAGFFSLSASTESTGMCEPGYFCPPGSTSSKQVPCPKGYYRSTVGAGSLTDCSLCPAGAYCPRGTSDALACPRGFYCIEGLSEPEPCNPGTYGSLSGLRSSSDCSPCDGGSYCDGYGLTVPSGPCSPGYFCSSASQTSTPAVIFNEYQNFTRFGSNGICPRGFFCPLGTSIPMPCPIGTFNHQQGSSSDNACTACTQGFYCDREGISSPTDLCTQGFYCPTGSISGTQVQAIPGYYSVVGSYEMTPCPPTQYSNAFHQSSCRPCPVGHFCANKATSIPVICPAGSYCEASTALPVRCPAGTFSNVTGNVNILGCLSCPPGMYCNQTGLIAPSGKILPFFAIKNS